MPAFSTHHIFAEEVKDEIKSIDTELELCEPAYLFGTQGPDFLFTYRLWRMAWGGKTLIDLGSALHHCKPSELFGVMKDYLCKEDCDKAVVKSYIYGFICHYSLDRTAHPFVYAVQKAYTKACHLEKTLSIAVHSQIEFNIDTLLLKYEFGQEDGRAFNEASVLTTDEHIIDELGRLMAYVIPKVTDEKDITVDELKTAYRDMHLIYNLKYDPTGIKKAIVSVLGMPVRFIMHGPVFSPMMRPKTGDNKWDYLNLSHKPWTMVYDSRQTFTDSFIDLFRKAKKDAPALVKAFNSEDVRKSFEEITGNMSFDTGVRYDIENPVA